MRLTSIGLSCLAALPLPAQSIATLGASKDNTLYDDGTGSLSNGAGPGFFAGIAGSGVIHRGLIAFPVAASVPQGARILSVTLTLNMSRTLGVAYGVALHRATASWGEGTSVSPRGGGLGGQATTGDATWLHRYWPSTLWATPGGDFVPFASDTQQVDGIGRYSWSGPGLVADVQAWVCNPASNLGWVLVGDETTSPTTKRFDSRNHATASVRPQLAIQYLPPAAAVIPLGTGCQGFALAANGLPRIGNAAFALQLTGGVPNGFGVLCLALDSLAVPRDLGNGCVLRADPSVLAVVLAAPLDGSGGGVFGVPVPQDRELDTTCAIAQALSIDAQLMALWSSNGLTLIFGP